MRGVTREAGEILIQDRVGSKKIRIYILRINSLRFSRSRWFRLLRIYWSERSKYESCLSISEWLVWGAARPATETEHKRNGRPGI